MTTLNNNSPIGFFDSGVGGLTVLDKVKKLLPDENYIFIGDTIHVPYGDKTKEELFEYSTDILNYFKERNCKAVVMACNTTSSVVYNDIKDKYDFKLYPVVQSVAKVLSNLNIERLGVFATKATINSNSYNNEIAKYNKKIKVCGQYCPQWVNIVENNLINNKESTETVKNDLKKMLENNPQKIVLGCTHYPYLLPVLTKFASEEMFIDPAIYLAEYIFNDLKNNNLINTSTTNKIEEFYSTSNPEKFKESGKMFYDIKNEVKLIKL